jgi:hypothetical protein
VSSNLQNKLEACAFLNERSTVGVGSEKIWLLFL